MLKTDGAKWTVAVSDVAVDDHTISQSPSSSTFASDNSDNRMSRDCPKLEALKQIYEQICAIRNNHAQVVAENAAKRAEVCTAEL